MEINDPVTLLERITKIVLNIYEPKQAPAVVTQRLCLTRCAPGQAFSACETPCLEKEDSANTLGEV